MELYVNPQITGFRQEVDGTIKELKIGTNKEDAYANIIEQGADAKLENNKTVTITENGEVEITPTAGKDGMKKVTATVNVAGGGTTLYCWENEREETFYTASATPADEAPIYTSTGESGTPSRINATGFRVKHYSNGVLTVQEWNSQYDEWQDYETASDFVRYSTGDISLT
jgi:hypothetical protein